jgi:hypothetical protein
MSSILRFDEWQDSNGVPVATGAGGKFVAPGNILQVQNLTLPSAVSTSITTGSTFVDISGLSLSITPTSASSKILVIVSLSYASLSAGNSLVTYRLVRDSTPIGNGTAAGSRVLGFVSSYAAFGENIPVATINHLDSPATTSAVTYKIQGTAPGSTTIFVNRSSTDSDNTSHARTSSHITLMEVAA